MNCGHPGHPTLRYCCGTYGYKKGKDCECRNETEKRMKKRYESKWEGPGYYRVWEIQDDDSLVDWHKFAKHETEFHWNRNLFVYRKIELPPEPKPVIEFEPGLYRVKIRTGMWIYRKRTNDGSSLDICDGFRNKEFDTKYTAYQKLEPGEIVEVER
jgi:hypothetical protein